MRSTNQQIDQNENLCRAASDNDKEQANICLIRGANINYKNRAGYTPLELAVLNGHIEMVLFLWEKKADVSCNHNRILTLAARLQYANPLGEKYLTDGDVTKMTRLLLSIGADSNAIERESEHNFSALHYALWFKHYTAAKMLLGHDASIDYQLRTTKESARGNAKGNPSELEFVLDRSQYIIVPARLRPIPHGLTFPFFKLFTSTIGDYRVHTFLLILGAMLAIKQEEISNRHVAAGTVLICLGMLGLAVKIAECTGLIGKRAERVADELEALLRDFGRTAQTANDAIRILNGTAEQVILDIRDESTQSIRRLTGAGEQIAIEIQRGIRENRFKPEAHVDVNAVVPVVVSPCNII